MNESANPILKYFSEFKILKTVSKDFWLTTSSSSSTEWPIFP